ncbi:MAG TPA: hypothetical protein VG675_11755 [Bryobacteraceae bacterium]|nr:hypothetical protein [Bryobacteraceae bacterium]
MRTMSEQDLSLFEEHLLICEPCRERVAASDAYFRAMVQASQLLQDRGESVVETWKMPRFAIAWAMALLVVVVGATLWITRIRPEASAFAVQLQTTRGSVVGAKAPAGRPLVLDLDMAGLPAAPSYRLEMVDSLGARVWQGTLPAGSTQVRLGAEAAGAYYVRVYSTSGELLREYGLQVSR